MATSTDLRSAIEEVQQSLPADQVAAPDELPVGDSDWTTRLERRVGALPWWVISATVHAVVFLLIALLAVAVPPANIDEVVIATDVAKQKPPEYDPAKQRDIFKNTKDVQADTQVENPVVTHEPMEQSDHFETDNNMDKQTSRGTEDAISDIPLGGTGTVGSIGVGSGGLAGVFGYRDGGGRKKAVGRWGGSPATESAVEAALRWLARHQEPDGHWDINKYEGGGSVSGGLANDEAVTALALLAFLGAGYTHRSGGPFQATVSRSTEWLLKQQRADGGWGDPGQASGYSAYAEGLGALAMAESFGMTRDERLGASAQKGVNQILKVQNRYAGWQHGGNLSTSVTGWMVMALKSAKIAGLKVDSVGFQGATKWLDDVTDPTTGMVGYGARGQYAYAQGLSMTAVGMVCRQFMGVANSDPLLLKEAELLAKTPPKWEPKSEVSSPQEPYYWYYGTLAMFQMGGAYWAKWNEALKPTLVNNQCKANGQPLDGSVNDKDGSWDADMGWGPTGGRVYHTAINALSLEIYYRYLPMYAK
jgi:hypothetical protein